MWSESLAARVLEVLAARGETLATAESLTGGMLSSLLTDVPGASRSFVGGVVSYATRVKISVLDVPAEVVERHGVVSEECAAAMDVKLGTFDVLLLRALRSFRKEWDALVGPTELREQA